MKMLFFFKLSAVLLLMIVMSSCANLKPDDIVYDQNSWQTIITDSCLSFYDGCNNCRRSKPGAAVAACTRKACDKYEKPVCINGTR